MNNLPFDTAGLEAGEADNLKEIFATLSKRFMVDTSCDEKLPLDGFDLVNACRDLNRHTDFTVGGLLKVDTAQNECYLVFLKLRSYTTNKARSGEGLDYFGYLGFALVRQKKDFGRALIRRETFTDRILSVIHPVQLEFEDDKAFTHRYYIVANDPEKAKAAMGFDFRNTLMNIDLDNDCIETNGSDMLITINNGLDSESAVRTVEMALKLAAVR